jgi:aryl-alcohol dehydrogenase-like predicted oxidoreductase
MQHRIEAHRDQLEAYEGLCRELGAKPAEVALAWLLRNPVVSTTIVGATTTEELQKVADVQETVQWTAFVRKAVNLNSKCVILRPTGRPLPW